MLGGGGDGLGDQEVYRDGLSMGKSAKRLRKY